MGLQEKREKNRFAAMGGLFRRVGVIQWLIFSGVGIASERNTITTAEGVETRSQLETVRELGCTQMQGYLFSAARPAHEIRAMLVLEEAAAASVA